MSGLALPSSSARPRPPPSHPPRPHLPPPPPPARPLAVRRPPSARHRPRPLLRLRRWGPALGTWLRAPSRVPQFTPTCRLPRRAPSSPARSAPRKRRRREARRERPPALGGENGPRLRLPRSPPPSVDMATDGRQGARRHWRRRASNARAFYRWSLALQEAGMGPAGLSPSPSRARADQAPGQ